MGPRSPTPPPGLAQIGAWLLLVLCGLMVLYAIQLTVMTLAFWLVRIDNLSALTDTLVGVARYPPNIFGKTLGFVFTFILPFAFIAYVPVLALKDGASPAWLGGGLLVTTLFVVPPPSFSATPPAPTPRPAHKPPRRANRERQRTISYAPTHPAS